MEISDDAFLPGFPEQITGLKKGAEKTFSLSVPEEYTNPELAGKTVEFTVLVKAIKEKVMPEANDEFAKDLGEYSGLTDLKKKLNESLTEKKRSQSEAGLREKIFDILIEKNPFPVPGTMVETQVRNMIKNAQQMLESQGMKLEDMGQSMGQLFEQYKTPAERQVRSTLLLGAIADREGLVAEDKDFETRYQEFAEQMRQDVAAVKAKIDPEMLRPLILEKKALEFIISKAKITEK
jgi:trigger factor